ncbi:MAG: hypothetical protein LBL37_09045 [Gracilibacteraceae bacterium]|jgi:GNAT superfamily N-acetyltransferase|nr:hypothetical protein [Gracilibacteraceae bacterium]
MPTKDAADPRIDIRFARPDEAPRLIALLRRQHGGLYPRASYYDEGFIAEAVATEKLRFAVAVAGDGETAGMICAGVQSDDPPVLVFSLLTVLPAWRGQGLGSRMQDFLDTRLPLSRYAYTCMYCLTLDTASQHNSVKRGYVPTGLLPHRYLFDPAAANLEGEALPLKRSHLLLCRAFSRRDAGPLFCPDELADFTAEVFGALGVGFSRGAAAARSSRLAGGPSVFRLVQNEEHRYCEIWIERAGGDLPDLLRAARRYDALPAQTYCVSLNMAHANCPGAYRVLREQGYVCTGLAPFAAGGAYLLFYRSPSVALDYGRLALHPSFRALWEKIKDVA